MEVYIIPKRRIIWGNLRLAMRCGAAENWYFSGTQGERKCELH